MIVHQCPKCELRFAWLSELDDHCRTDHPEFEHGYPVPRLADHRPAEEPAAGEAVRLDAEQATSKIVATWWSER